MERLFGERVADPRGPQIARFRELAHNAAINVAPAIPTWIVAVQTPFPATPFAAAADRRRAKSVEKTVLALGQLGLTRLAELRVAAKTLALAFARTPPRRPCRGCGAALVAPNASARSNLSKAIC